VTHLHPDHVGSAHELALLWSLPVYVHPLEVPLTVETYPPEYYGPIDRWLVAPLLRVLPRRSRGLNVADVARAFDPSAVPGLADWTCIHTPGQVAFFGARTASGRISSGLQKTNMTAKSPVGSSVREAKESGA
jgi:glyoxylase-like metal-dependent hydrolase (beta-lactamase superfamily II)